MIKKFIIVTRSQEGHSELCWSTRHCPQIETFLGNFSDIANYDCLATAGNSFGLMDAGFDLAVLKYFGDKLLEDIQTVILQDYLGEQPVGSSFLVKTHNPKHPWLAHAPTMRVPMNISGTDNIYLATWATLLAVHQANKIDAAAISTIVFPAFGTGTGGVSHLEAGVQIRLAIEHYLTPPTHIIPSSAQLLQESIHYGGLYGFKNPRPIE
ncbi:MAG: macro domain-containing protein [Verrucomicrobiales bacterium]|nr:macro domain-containing protein [Verrucomicrobiales bacterium]